ncbi:MAG: aminoacylase, partial [Candidatus Methanomethylicota archaeon]
MAYDIVIVGGRVINGAGTPWTRADIAIKDGVIVELGYLKHPQADIIIKAEDLFVCPGFIDIHNHSDLALLIDPIADSMIRQGVTTLTVGNCGLSVAPVKREFIELFKKHVESFAPAPVEWKWESFDEYLRALEGKGVGVNVVPFVGHGTIRAMVLGFEPKEPSENELNQMKLLVEESMKAGAFGLTTGLIYLPGMYAKTSEIIELAKVVAKYGGIYASHIRSESFVLIEAVAEAIEIGAKANIPVEISHHKASGVENWGKVKTTLKMMEDARINNIEIT